MEKETSSSQQMHICPNCGQSIPKAAIKCMHCKAWLKNPQPSSLRNEEDVVQANEQEKEGTAKTVSGGGFVARLNDYMGNTSPVDLNWKSLFTDVFKSHTTAEAEEIFISGTPTTTPLLKDVSRSWPHPWLYSRVLLMFSIAFFLLKICCEVFKNENAIPSLIFVGAFAVPISIMILFVEVNAFRNISIYKVLKMFFIGGCASVTLTLLLYEFVDVEELDFTAAITIGVVEEIGKGVIIYYFLKQLNHKYILCGMLIGATIGAGFSALESAGYVLSSGAAEGWDDLLATMFVRGVTAPAGHETWSAIVGAALAIGAKANGNQLSINVVTNKAFLRLAVLPIVLHGLWDSPLNQSLLTVVGLTILVWVIVLILVNMGLSEVEELCANENMPDSQPAT